MALYKFLNGWKNFRIKAERGGDVPGNAETFDFTFKLASFVESYEKSSVRYEYLNGKKKKKSFYINLRWDVDYGKHLEADDLEKFARIETLELLGYELTLTPHIDVKDRAFKVQLIDERKEYGKQYHHRGKKSTAHQGYKTSFENTEPITSLIFVNLNTYLGDVGVIINPMEI